jgi:membrane protease YdiL (CAAX protease family)
MTKEHKSLLIVFILFAVWTALLGIGGYLFITCPENEALGGIVLGLAGTLVGIVIPFHLKRTGILQFRFLPAQNERENAFIVTCGFLLFFLGIFPFGILGTHTLMKVLAHPPAMVPAVITFLFLLFSAISYALLFWGGLLHSLKKTVGIPLAMLITSALFSLYHLAEFAFVSITPGFLLLMFIGALMLTGLTVYLDCVVPTMIVHQLLQFLDFVSMKDNPFTDPAGLMSNAIMLAFFLGIYALVRRFSPRTKY